MKNIFIIGLLFLSLASCRKDPQSVFSGQDGVTFYYKSGPEQDSVSYSFKANVVPKTKDTVYIKMRLVGKLANYDREISVVADKGSTAVEGTHFILPKTFMQADSFEVRYPVVLLNSPDLVSKTVRLVLRVADSKDLIVGTVGQADYSTRNTAVFKINFSNNLIKPDYWDYIGGYVGPYSNVRYQFMIDALGTSNFRPNTKGGLLTYPDFLNFKAVLGTALNEYEKKNGPLMDENNLRITFN
ncbi:DUF4843 domain-containing protein [Sphingobacterium yanglingense]|uniref:Uncharacterized protein DUF4843 n=1 Tax=Sphingobacterium yanglingense TaxID=1437280 RepID=A0A4R6W1K3_9SPHI|nr:DUF4843 domain-containing protein [Sphingobacterium yanglingense]TDQ72240.1 uncharacterized protein DUF4843 [Sphingobacterium yanglingense]